VQDGVVRQGRYADALRLFLRSLRATGSTAPLLALVTADTPPSWRRLAEEHGVQMRTVSVLESRGTPAHYARMATKLHLWNLTEHASVAYYDVDTVFMRNPEPCFTACAAPLCAVRDPGIKRRYFNAGFLVLTPNAAEYERLLGLRHLADGQRLAEQDMLNAVYAATWGQLPAACSYMPKAARKVAWLVPAWLRRQLRASYSIHEKFWQLRDGGADGLPAVNQAYWPWNTLLPR